VDTGTKIGLICGTVILLGGGIVLLIYAIKTLASGEEPDITGPDGKKVGRSGLYVFIGLGILLSAAGVGCLVGFINGVQKPEPRSGGRHHAAAVEVVPSSGA